MPAIPESPHLRKCTTKGNLLEDFNGTVIHEGCKGETEYEHSEYP